MKRPQLVSPGTLNRLLKTAEAAWLRKDPQEAISILERASRLDPGNPILLLDLGYAYGKGFDYALAEQAFERAIRIASDKLQALTTAGQRSYDFGQSEMAENYFNRALAQTHKDPELFVRLGDLYERRRRLADAAEMVKRALDLNAGCGSALLLRAKLDQQAGRLGDAERVLQSVLTNPDRFVRARAGYQLGSVLDKQGRYDEAMAAWVEAKRLLAPEAVKQNAELKIIRAQLKRLQEQLSPEVIQNWLSFRETLGPVRQLALLCGHPRSGTTLLEQVLDSHPAIVSAEETEVFHDSAYMPLTRALPEGASMFSVLETSTDEQLRQSRMEYFRVIQKSVGSALENHLLVDKNPSLTFLIPHFLRVFPEAKLLVALRDPRDVCLSCFMQPFVPLGQVSSAYLTLESTVEEYSALMGMWHVVKTWLPHQYLEISYERLTDALEAEARRVLEFLGVSWNSSVLRFHEHAQGKLVKSPTYAEVAKPIFRTAVGRWRNYEKHLAPHMTVLERFMVPDV